MAMYNHLKQRFKLTDTKISEIIKNNDACEEIFRDYETIRKQQSGFAPDQEFDALNNELIEMLESEINLILSEDTKWENEQIQRDI